MVFIYPAVDGEKKQEVPLLSSTKFSSQSPPPDLYLLADEEEEPLSPEEAQLVTDLLVNNIETQSLYREITISISSQCKGVPCNKYLLNLLILF